jgi:hypothetical protein
MSILKLFEDSPYRKVERYAQSRQMTSFLDCIAWFPLRKLLPAKCQRELCWSLEQYQCFIIHCMETRDAGHFILYRHEETDDRQIRYILDGQHRIHAWQAFKAGEFNIFYAGREISFNDFTSTEIKILESRITCTYQDVVTSGDYDYEITELIYNRFNFSGVAHERKECQ